MRDFTSRTGRAGWRSGARLARTAAVLAAGALVALFWSAGSPSAVAQQPTPKVSTRQLLRPLYANSMDIEEGRQVAQHFCADCHGSAGISTIAGVPNLAGQRSAYLYSEMRAYLSGARGDDTMNGAITYLSADAMSNVAAFYGSLPPAEPKANAKAPTVDAVDAGKAAAATCGACHGATGISATPGVPSLVGQEPKYLVTALGEYKSGERKDDTMKAMVGQLSSAVMNNIALYYALEKPARAATPIAGDAAAGQAASAPCAACHGAQGSQRQSVVAEPGRPGCQVPRRRPACLQERRPQEYDDGRTGGGARRHHDQEPRRLLRRPAAAAAERAQAAEHRRSGSSAATVATA